MFCSESGSSNQEDVISNLRDSFNLKASSCEQFAQKTLFENLVPSPRMRDDCLQARKGNKINVLSAVWPSTNSWQCMSDQVGQIISGCTCINSNSESDSVK